MTDRDHLRLTGVHPALADAVTRILTGMAGFGVQMFVVEGLRSTARQQELYAQGRTTPGPIVTQIDGVTKKSMHQAQSDGLGHAVDCAFVDDPFAEAHPWPLYGLMGTTLGLAWGGNWVSFKDRPHLELPVLH